MASFPILRQVANADTRASQTLELCERAGAAILLAAVSPVAVISGALLAAISGRSPLIAHRRVGWRGETLWVLKLRTMWDGPRTNVARRGWIEYVEDDAGPDQKHEADPRVGNWFASFCRRHSLDEIPQLWQVIRGEMALIGPRPVTARELREHYGRDAEMVLSIKPGIAGLWQISGRNRLTYAERRALDLEFVRHRSIGMYVRIFLHTVMEVFRGTNSW